MGMIDYGLELHTSSSTYLIGLLHTLIWTKIDWSSLNVQANLPDNIIVDLYTCHDYTWVGR
ncbi:hypothetical protein LXL04_013508 [Taraxacum kok-saghyz]